MSKMCCDELRDYRAIFDNVKMSEYSPETKEMTTFRHCERYEFLFCPFCGTSQFFVVR